MLREKGATVQCLSCLDDDSLRNSVAIYTLWFAQMEKETQQLITEKICATKRVVVGDDSRQRNPNLPLYFLPFTTELPAVVMVLGSVKVCKHAMMALLRHGRRHGTLARNPSTMGRFPSTG